MENFLCKLCGGYHDFYGRIKVLEPDIMYNMSKKEKSERIFSRNFLHIIDKSISFSEGILSIQIKGTDNFIEWEVWVNLDSFDDYVKMVEKLKVGPIAYIKGRLSSVIPLYEECETVEVRLKYERESRDQPPIVEIVNRDSIIGNEFLNGISKERLIEWTERLYHPE